jgi:hypothetical protein
MVYQQAIIDIVYNISGGRYSEWQLLRREINKIIKSSRVSMDESLHCASK